MDRRNRPRRFRTVARERAVGVESDPHAAPEHRGAVGGDARPHVPVRDRDRNRVRAQPGYVARRRFADRRPRVRVASFVCRRDRAHPSLRIHLEGLPGCLVERLGEERRPSGRDPGARLGSLYGADGARRNRRRPRLRLRPDGTAEGDPGAPRGSTPRPAERARPCDSGFRAHSRFDARRNRHRRVPILVSGNRQRPRSIGREPGHGDRRGGHAHPRRRVRRGEPRLRSRHRDTDAPTAYSGRGMSRIAPSLRWTLRRIRRVDLSPGARVGAVMVALALGVALVGPFFAPYPPDAIFGAAFAKPSSQHLLGLDFVGRDVLSRFLWGGRTAIFIALIGTVVGVVVGIVIGTASAYWRGWFDEIFGRLTDLALAFPALIFAL